MNIVTICRLSGHYFYSIFHVIPFVKGLSYLAGASLANDVANLVDQIDVACLLELNLLETSTLETY